MAWLFTYANMGMQLRSLRSLRPAANGLANSCACFQGISGIQVPLSLHLTTSNAPVRDGTRAVQATSAYPGPLVEMEFLACHINAAHRVLQI